MKRKIAFLLVLVIITGAVILSGCNNADVSGDTSSAASSSDTSSANASSADASSTDTSSAEASSTDTSSTDASSTDASSTDTPSASESSTDASSGDTSSEVSTEPLSLRETIVSTLTVLKSADINQMLGGTLPVSDFYDITAGIEIIKLESSEVPVIPLPAKLSVNGVAGMGGIDAEILASLSGSELPLKLYADANGAAFSLDKVTDGYVTIPVEQLLSLAGTASPTEGTASLSSGLKILADYLLAVAEPLPESAFVSDDYGIYISLTPEQTLTACNTVYEKAENDSELKTVLESLFGEGAYDDFLNEVKTQRENPNGCELKIEINGLQIKITVKLPNGKEIKFVASLGLDGTFNLNFTADKIEYVSLTGTFTSDENGYSINGKGSITRKDDEDEDDDEDDTKFDVSSLDFLIVSTEGSFTAVFKPSENGVESGGLSIEFIKKNVSGILSYEGKVKATVKSGNLTMTVPINITFTVVNGEDGSFAIEGEVKFNFMLAGDIKFNLSFMQSKTTSLKAPDATAFESLDEQQISDLQTKLTTEYAPFLNQVMVLINGLTSAES